MKTHSLRPLPTALALGALAAGAFSTAACSSEVGSSVVEEVGAQTAALCSGSGACTATTSTGHLGRWPGGQIKYQIIGDASFKAMVESAMTDWQNAADQIIQFVP